MSDGWQLKCTEVKQRLEVLLDLKLWTDCWFAVGPRRATRAAHRALLAAASPVFRDLIFGQERDYYDEIDAHETDIDAFDAMLHYIYTDEVHIESRRGARGLCLAAHRYALPHLRARCAAYLLAHLEPASACGTYEFAEQIGDEQLKEACLQMMSDRTLDVLEAGSWVEAREETVARVFALDELRIESELQLLAAAERSARARAPARPGRDPAPEGPEQSPLRGAVHNIRFLTLAPEEFAKHPTPKALLADSDIMAIILNITNQHTPVPMPSGFSTSRTSRVQIKLCPGEPPDVTREAGLVPKQLTASTESVTKPKVTSALSQSSPVVVTCDADLVVETPVVLPDQLSVSSDNDSMVSSAGESPEVTPPKEVSFFKNLFSLFRDVPAIGTSDSFNSGEHDKSRKRATVRVTVDLKELPHDARWFNSATWYVRGLPWRLGVLRAPDDNHIFAAIECNWEDRSGWSCAAELEARLVPHKPGLPPLQDKFNFSFTKKSWRIYGIRWEDALDPGAGYLHDDKLIVEVDVKTRAP